jgi:hypothetical protein
METERRYVYKEINLKRDVEEINYEDVNWIKVVQVGVQ